MTESSSTKRLCTNTRRSESTTPHTMFVELKISSTQTQQDVTSWYLIIQGHNLKKIWTMLPLAVTTNLPMPVSLASSMSMSFFQDQLSQSSIVTPSDWTFCGFDG